MNNRRLDHSVGSAAHSAAHMAREAVGTTMLVGMMLVGMMLAGIVIVLTVPVQNRLTPR